MELRWVETENRCSSYSPTLKLIDSARFCINWSFLFLIDLFPKTETKIHLELNSKFRTFFLFPWCTPNSLYSWKYREWSTFDSFCLMQPQKSVNKFYWLLDYCFDSTAIDIRLKKILRNLSDWSLTWDRNGFVRIIVRRLY